ncbi:MAG: YidC/Oxa1 family membrane protein insertase [Eubacteriales bacterium]
MSILYNLFGKMLLVIYQFVGNYGIAIIVFTIIAKLIQLPITIKQTKSMQDSNKIQPEIQKLQKQYAKNREKLNEETMKLYKEHGVNPMGSCLPLLIQFPIIIGLFTVLRNPAQYVFGTQAAYDAIQKSFLWIPSLGDKDPYFILPILAAVTTYFYMTNTPTQSAGNGQAQSINKSMKIMSPIMIGYVAYISPSGLGLYWVVQNILTYIQQAIMLKGKKNPEGGQ